MNCFQTTQFCRLATNNRQRKNLTASTVLDDADYIPYYDTSITTNKKTLWSNIKAKLKTYFDTLYAALSHTHGNITNDGKVGADANKVITTTTAGAIQAETENTAFNKAFGTDNPVMDGTPPLPAPPKLFRGLITSIRLTQAEPQQVTHKQQAQLQPVLLMVRYKPMQQRPGTLTDAQVRDIYAGTSDMTVGVTSLTTGAIYCFYETE